MSDLSDSQNASGEAFLTESDPSSSSIDQTPEPEISRVGRTRLYLTASQSGDKQTLRELRHQILARRTRRHSLADAVPGLDVTPLREHAWLDSLADAGVRVSSCFHERLQESVTPNPPIIDLGDDSESPSTMAREDGNEATYQRRADATASKAPIVEEVSRADEENETGPGTSALWLPEDDCNGPLSVEIDESWRRDALDYTMPDEHRPLSHLPAPPSTEYLTMHSSTNGRRGGNRHGPQNLRRRGRGASTSVRVPIVASTSAANSPTVPLRPSTTRTVTRGGSVSRRRSREQTVEDSAANKRQAVEDPGASTAHEVLVEDLDPSTEEVQVEGATAVGVGTAGGGSLVSDTTSSIKEKLRELIATPSFLSNLSPGIFYRFREWIEKKEVPLSDTVAAAFAPQTVTPGKIYQPNWDVREDESLYSNIPENGGILAYRILKGMQLPLDRPLGSLKTPPARLAHDQLVANNVAIELIEQYLEYQRLADSYKASLETCQDLLQEAEKKVAPLEDEVATLRDRAALLEETEENVKVLTKAVEAANTEKDIAVLEASTAEARVWGFQSFG
ncbi:hypothetical protein BVRB_7g165980 [Beta vulgaris subsp. vulgaris]|uniref:Uncharacterized protein n=1 Tax=Beta vulgaris subsp. vulgaris TaxID=3555 RepID=A0A0J8C0I7_BETVV|nr:hypothetical protein BVRB_7g165980 [Beta vulgaris subsp. vulgaris]